MLFRRQLRLFREFGCLLATILVAWSPCGIGHCAMKRYSRRCSQTLDGGKPSLLTPAGRVAIAQNTGASERAIRDATEAIRLDPKNVAAFCHRGLGESTTVNMTRPLPTSPRRFGSTPKNAGALQQPRTSLGRTKGEDDKAIADFTEAIRTPPERIRPDSTTAEVRGAARVGDPPRPSPIHGGNSPRPQTAPRALNDRGFSWANQGEDDKAIADFTAW